MKPVNHPWKLLSIGLICILIVVMVREDYPQRLMQALKPDRSANPWDYRSNIAYGEQTSYHAMFQSQKNIVMLGNSLTFRMHWDELLGREDIANRGIGYDVIEGIYVRIGDILRLKPKICFIEAGVNDLANHVPIDTSVKYMQSIIDSLQSHQIIPVITNVFQVAGFYPDAATFNAEIAAFNSAIDRHFSPQKIAIMDVNADLAPKGILESAYALDDGIHLSAAAYQVWKRHILKQLAAAGL